MTVTLGILARDVAEPAQLRRVQMAIRHIDAQHRREALHVQAVAKAQRAEFIFGQLARVITRDLLAKLRGALCDQGLVDFIIVIHGESSDFEPERGEVCSGPGPDRYRMRSPFRRPVSRGAHATKIVRSEEHTSELQSLMRISYAVVFF